MDHLSAAANWWERFSSGQEVSRSPPLVQGGGAPVLLIADDDETKISANIGVNKSKSAV